MCLYKYKDEAGASPFENRHKLQGSPLIAEGEDAELLDAQIVKERLPASSKKPKKTAKTL